MIEKYKDKSWMYQKYIEEELSTHEIAKLAHCCAHTVWVWMKKLNVPLRSLSECRKMWRRKYPDALRGKNNPNWGRRGKDAIRWNGGRFVRRGYIFIYQPNHPHTTSNGYVREHRLIMEKHLKRNLYPWEIVHHINGVGTDNRIENLELLPGRGQHNTKIQEIYQENTFLKEHLANFLNIET